MVKVRTKKAMIKEIIKCGKDPLYFINNYAKIQHPTEGLIPFNTFDYQNDVVNAYLTHRKNVVLKARQLGISTVTAAYISWFILFNRNKNVLVVATKQGVAKNIVRIVRNVYKHLPAWLLDIGQAGNRRDNLDNRFSIELANGSRLTATTTSSDVGRSEAVSFLFVDECVSGDTIIVLRDKRDVKEGVKVRELEIKAVCDLDDLSNWEVLTPSGWSDFAGIKKNKKEKYYHIKTTSNLELKCSENHRLKLKDKTFIYAKDLKEGTQLFSGKVVEQVSLVEEPIELYDLIDVKKKNQYYTNGLVSHNCAHIKNFDEIWTGLGPVISTGGSVVLASTPVGTANYFYECFKKAQTKENNFNCELGNYTNPNDPNESYTDRLMWWVKPGCTMEWFKAETASDSPRKIAQERLCFAAGTKIVTDKGFKNIESLKVGDKVLTHKGKYRAIVETGSRMSDDVYKVKVIEGTEGEIVTGKHRVLVGKLGQWKSIEDLKQGSAIATSINYIGPMGIDEREFRYRTRSLIKKEKLKKTIRVYNIEVEKDHSFKTEHFFAHNCNFNASGDTFLWNKTISYLENKILQQPAPKPFHMDRNVWVWHEPVANAQYLLSLDASRGDAADYSAFHVIRIDGHPMVQVAEYKGKIRPDQLGSLVIVVSQIYNNAMIAPENNSGWSGQVIAKIQEAGHPFLYYSRRRRPKIKATYAPDPYYAETRTDYLPGYSVTSANRLPMLAKLEQYVRLEEIIINSQRLVDEFKTFIVTDANRPEAQRGMSDDLVMALAGGLWVRDESFMHYRGGDAVAEAMLNSMTLSNPKANQMRGFDFSTSQYDKQRIKEHVAEQNKIVMGNGDVVDLNWLIQDGPPIYNK